MDAAVKVGKPRLKDVNRLLESHTFGPLMSHKQAHAAYMEVRAEHGLSTGTPSAIPLLSQPDAIGKLAKGKELVWDSHRVSTVVGLSLAPAGSSLAAQVCRWRTKQCEKYCLASAGNGKYPRNLRVRACRTAFLVADPDAFVSLVHHELVKLKASIDGNLGFRPNVLSDILWERYAQSWFGIDGVYNYDYTKNWGRPSQWNYHLTYSATERHSVSDIQAKVSQGDNVAVVFALRKGEEMPTTWAGLRVVDGDLHDFRPADHKGVVVGLSPKGDLPIDAPFTFDPNL